MQNILWWYSKLGSILTSSVENFHHPPSSRWSHSQSLWSLEISITSPWAYWGSMVVWKCGFAIVCIIRGAGLIHIFIPTRKNSLPDTIPSLFWFQSNSPTRSAVESISRCTDAGKSNHVVIYGSSPSYITIASLSEYGQVLDPRRTWSTSRATCHSERISSIMVPPKVDAGGSRLMVWIYHCIW